MELIFAMLLLGIIMITVAFSSSAVISAVKNRVDASSDYVLAMNKAESVVYAQSSYFADSATFNIAYTGTRAIIKYWEAIPTATGGYSIPQISSTIDFNAEMEKAGVSNVTVTVTTSTSDPNIVIVNLTSVDKTGRRYENTAILKKLINAAPLLPANLPSCSFEGPTMCTFTLLFPAVSFFPTTSTTSVITTTTGSTFSEGKLSPATYSLTGTQTIPSICPNGCYTSLSIQTSTSATLIQIPKMKGLDSTVSDEVWVKVH